MFERKTYKSIALKQLKNRWTTPVLITIFITVITSLINCPSFTEDSGISNFVLLISLLGILVNSVMSLAETSVYCKLSRTRNPATFNDFIKGFSMWAKAFLGHLWFTIWVTLWSFLFIIPGIVKAFAYSQMFYVIAENPEISVGQAMEISKVMTKGHKGDLFTMALSFLGWGILCILTAGIGFFWLNPYMKMSFTNAYHALKIMSIQKGELKESDFGPVESETNAKQNTASETADSHSSEQGEN